MLKKYKVVAPVEHKHVHGPNCSHGHHDAHDSHDEHHGHHDHESYDPQHDFQMLFEEGDFAMLKAELSQTQSALDAQYDIALCEWEATHESDAFAKLEKLTHGLKAASGDRCVGLLNLAFIYSEKKQNDKAKTFFENALELAKPESALQAERKIAEEHLAKLNSNSLKDKLFGFFK